MARKTAGVVVRHHRQCPSRAGDSCGSPCRPRFEAWVWSPRDKKKIYQAFDNPSEAKNWRGDVGSSVRKGQLRAPEPTTVEQKVTAWLEAAQRGEVLKPDGTRYKPGVLRGYGTAAETFILPMIGGMRFARLQRRDVQAIVDWMVGKGYSGSTVRNAVMVLRAVCRRAIRNDELLVNPTANLELPAAAGTRDRVASPVEAAALLAALPEAQRALWATALYAGLRRGELRGLRWSDIDDAVTVIHVQRGWDNYEGEIAPKSRKGNRKVPVGTELRKTLLEHKAATGRRESDLVFGRTATNAFTTTHVRKQALKAWGSRYTCGCDTADEKPKCNEHDAGRYVPIGLHECRHTYVSFMHDAGFSLERIGDYVGHSSAYMTDRYRHLLDGHEQEAADVLDAYLAERTGAQTGVQAPARRLQAASLSQSAAA
jgi:integrase